MIEWISVYELIKEIGAFVGSITAIAAAAIWCIRQVNSYRTQRKATALEEKKFEEKLAEYYSSLGLQTDPSKQAELSSVITIKALLTIKDEADVRHAVSRTFLVAILLIAWSIWTSTYATKFPLLLSVFKLVNTSLVIASVTIGIYVGEKIDKQAERNRLKFSKYLESASKDLLDDKFR